jgi:hypothetical protein
MIDATDRHPDPADVASANEELARQSAMITSRRPAGPAATGFCLHCGEPVEDGRRWCDGDHRDAWQRDQRHK